MQAPPHAPQQIKVGSWSHDSNSYINWDAKICNKLKNGKKQTPFTWMTLNRKKNLSYFQSCWTDIQRGVKLFTGMF